MSQVTALHRVGRFVTGLGALVILIGVLVGGPVALLALAGNPLPDHVPTLDEVVTVLTSRDDGQLFLRALALLGWLGWATFALSVLVEVPARILRRPAIRLPGLGHQQRAAAALVGSVAMILAVSPAATATAATLSAPVAATAPATAPAGATAFAGAAPAGVPAPAGSTATVAAPASHLATHPGTASVEPEPLYRVEKGDYLGHIAGRYLGEFDRYPELAKLNKIRNPDRIRPGQLLRLPETAADRGHRPHATGLVAVPPPGHGTSAPTDAAKPTEPAGRAGMGPAAEEPSSPAQPEPDHARLEEFRPGQPGPDQHRMDVVPEDEQPLVPAVPSPRRPSPDEKTTDGTTFASATGPSQRQPLNRPLAVTAVIAAASVVGAQIGALLGLRRPAGSGHASGTAASRSRAATTSGRHRRPSR